MKSKLVSIVVFILSFISLIISIKLFYNVAIFVDEAGTSPDVVYGGEFWLWMDWLRLGLNALVCGLSGITIFLKK